MAKQNREGNLISFKVLLTAEGNLVTEISGIPLDKIDKVFSKEDRKSIKTLVEQAKIKLEPLHLHLQREIQAL